MKKILQFIFLLTCFWGSVSTSFAKTTRVEFDEYLTHITCFIHFTKNLYPSYLEFKEKTPYGLDRAKKWASGRVFGWFEGNDPSKIWVSERFGEMGYRMATGLPFDHESPCPFEVAVLHQRFRTNILMIQEWEIEGKKYEYWTIQTDSKLGRGSLFLLLGADSVFETRKILFIDSLYCNTFYLNEDFKLEVDESNLNLFSRIGQFEFSKSYEGSIWEKMAPAYEYNKKTKEHGNELKLQKIPWSLRRYKELFTEERRRILANYFDKQDLLPSKENAVIAKIENRN